MDSNCDWSSNKEAVLYQTGSDVARTGWSGGWHSYQDRVEWWVVQLPGQGEWWVTQLPGQGGVVGGTATRTGWSDGWHSYQERVVWWVVLEPGQGGVVGGTGQWPGHRGQELKARLPWHYKMEDRYHALSTELQKKKKKHTFGISVDSNIPNDCVDSSGAYILRPRVFWSSVIGPVSVMVTWYRKPSSPGLGRLPTNASAGWRKKAASWTRGEWQIMLLCTMYKKHRTKQFSIQSGVRRPNPSHAVLFTTGRTKWTAYCS